MPESIDYHSYFENSPVGLWRTKTEDGQFVAANQACATILGCQSVEELLGLKSTNFYVNGDRQHMIEELMTKGSVNEYEVQMLRRDGMKIWLSVTARIEDKFIEGSITDITNKKLSESYIETCKIKEVKKLVDLQQGIRKKIKDISVSIISDRRNS